MPDYYKPGSDLARAAFLKTAFGAAKSDKEVGTEYILGETFKKLEPFATNFEEKVTKISQKLSSRSKEIDERNSHLGNLSTFVRDGFEVVRRQVNRENLPAHVLQLYGLPLDGTTPQPTTAAEWLTIAKTFVEGTKKVAEQGFQVVSCPSPEEIEKKLKKAEKEYEDVVTADRSYDDAQAGMADMRKEADELIADVMAELRLTLRKLDMPSQRRIQRSYGAQFKYLKGEEVDPGDNEPIIDEVTEEAAS